MSKKLNVFVVTLFFVLILSACGGVVEYKVDKIEAVSGVDTKDVESIFFSTTITVKNNVMVVKSGSETRLVLELQEGNQTGISDYTYTYTNDGLKLIYKKNVEIVLVKQ